MRQVTVTEKEAGQRLDKYLHKLLPTAPSSFFYRMLRKKNITLNGKKAEGKEKLVSGDTLTLFLSEETIRGFGLKAPDKKNAPGKAWALSSCEEAYKKLKGVQVLYEDDHILIMNKPSGILSQKASKEDLSLNEWMLGYLLARGEWEPEKTAAFKPSICNRLDRNTSGLLIGAKSIAGSQMAGSLLRDRSLRKFYRMIVKGQITREETLEGYLKKDESSNFVRLCTGKEPGALYIKTRYYPLRQIGGLTLVEAELITGKPHQLRIHLAGQGHPLVGDYKYGDTKLNDKYKRRFQIDSQLLYACRLEFPRMEAPFENLSERIIELSAPREFLRLMEPETS